LSLGLPFLLEPAVTARSTSVAQSEQDTLALEPGVPIERELIGGQAHAYRVMLAAGQYLHIVVEQRGIDVVVMLFGPEGQRLIKMDSPNGTQGPEPISLVAEASGNLAGVVTLKSLVVAPRDMLVRELMDPSPISLSPEMDQEEAVNLFAKYKLKGAPVIARDRKLMGIVVYRDIVEVAREEVEEDFAKMAGMPVTHSRSAFEIARTRLPWLVATCFGGLAVSYVIKHYEPTLSKIVVLATFIPLIAGMGGNVGSQTATIMVRGLATREIDPRRAARPILKEVLSGAIIGLFYALVVGIVAHFFYGPAYGWRFAAVVAAAMMVSMSAAATLGAVQPLVFLKLGIDPATATAPFITTATDLLSNLVYFSLATYLLL